MVDLILVDPPTSATARLGKLSTVASLFPSLGLGYLAAVARKEGFSVKIIDANVLQLTPKELVKEIIKEHPRFIGITATTLIIDTVGGIARDLKKKIPEAIIIVGGAHITAVSKETLKKYSAIDIGVIGEGEETLKELLSTLNINKGTGLTRVKGLIFRDKKRLITTPPRPLINDLDSLPMPAWDLFPNFPHDYHPASNSFTKLPAAGLFTSRGCGAQCLFCARAVFGRTQRMHSSKRVLEMMEHLVKEYGIKEIQFFDDNVALFPKRLEEICRGLIRKKWRVSWLCMARCDMLNPKKLALMKRAGCWQIGLGIESGSEKILKILRKGETKEVITRGVEMTAKAGIEAKGYLIIGNPGETKETIKETINFVLSIPLTYILTSFFTPTVGSAVYPVASSYGRFNYGNNWTRLGGGTIKPVFIPTGLNRRILEEANAELFRKFYFRPRVLFYQFKKIIFTPNRWLVYFKALISVASQASVSLRIPRVNK